MIRACADWQGEIGAYIVGALDERTTAAVSQHLASCAGCRAEYHELAPVRGWLSRLTRRQPHPQYQQCPRRDGQPSAGRSARARDWD